MRARHVAAYFETRAVSSSSEDDCPCADLTCELITQIAPRIETACGLSSLRPDEEPTDTISAECAEVCEGGSLLVSVISPVKYSTGATIWTALPDVSVTYSAVLGAQSKAMMP